jgi:hypothetical protein
MEHELNGNLSLLEHFLVPGINSERQCRIACNIQKLFNMEVGKKGKTKIKCKRAC